MCNMCANRLSLAQIERSGTCWHLALCIWHLHCSWNVSIPAVSSLCVTWKGCGVLLSMWIRAIHKNCAMIGFTVHYACFQEGVPNAYSWGYCTVGTMEERQRYDCHPLFFDTEFTWDKVRGKTTRERERERERDWKDSITFIWAHIILFFSLSPIIHVLFPYSITDSN